jgi:hypothetical protein
VPDGALQHGRHSDEQVWPGRHDDGVRRMLTYADVC